MGILNYSGKSPDSIPRAVNHLEEFRSDRQMHYMAFNGVVGSRSAALEKHRSIFAPATRDLMFYAGTQFPDREQSPGSSTIVQVKQSEFLDA